MAIKERVLEKMEAVEVALCQGGVDGLVFVKKISDMLIAVKNLCRQGLPEMRYAYYADFFDTLRAALSQISFDQASNDYREILALSQELCGQVGSQLKEEKQFKKEIVFLPYKASMWDSMESVWQAAVDDSEHAIAYVVPIPYVDRTPDGNVRECHCETEKFPEYVPVINFRHIDLERMRPDIIIIHNPYDEYNAVTSVDAKYYSKNLKNWTDKLVYIPYFVLEEIDTEDEKALDSIAHFIFDGRGVLNADLTIVQSENMREAYLRLLEKYTNQNRGYWEKRILGLGSPKIDKVLSTKREDIQLPEKWERVIKKADGTRKKVIFYNMSLSVLLKHKDKLLDKVEWVFDQFRERQDEVAMLWRPHPLFEATIQSMVPELWKRYQRIVKRYRREKWGIYDDSEDMHRAIAVSDGYYGDGSSLVELFRVLKKPIMMQDMEMQ